MTIWRKEMLAVCVDDNFNSHPAIINPQYPKKGEVTRVEEVISRDNRCYLGFYDYAPDEAYCASKFRPAVQDGLSEKSTKRVTLDDLIKEGEPA